MNLPLREMAYAVANSLGVSRVMRHRRRKDTLILMYHGVVDDDAPFTRWTHLPASRFRWQMEWLRENYRVLPLQQVIAAMRTGSSLPDNTAVVTFDDGLKSTYTRAFPVLKDLRLPATVLLTTAYMGTEDIPTSSRIFLALRSTTKQRLDLRDHGLKTYSFHTAAQRDATSDHIRAHAKAASFDAKIKMLRELEAQLEVDPSKYPDYADEFRMMSWSQVKEMQQSKLIEFGAHGSHHEILSRLPHDMMRSEIVDSCEEVRQRLGVHDVTFAYPNGLPEDFSPEAKTVLREASASCGLSAISGLCSSGDDMFELKRVGIGNNVGRSRFAAMCSGIEAG